MTVMEAARIVERVQFCGAFKDMVVQLQRVAGMDAVQLAFAWRVPERDHRLEMVEVNFRDSMSAATFEFMGRGEVLRWVIRAFHAFVDHEKDEAFLLDRVRVLDPHTLKTRPNFEALAKEVRPCPNPAVPVRTDDEPPGSTAPGGSCPDGAP